MNNKAQVYLQCLKDVIIVECEITFNNPISDFTFSLNNLLIIDEITANTEVSFSKNRVWKYNPYTHDIQEIKTTANKPFTNLVIKYHGKICGWCNIVTENKIALSDYSQWFLHKPSIPLDFAFYINNMEDYNILNGMYNKEQKIWYYDDKEDYDTGNIIAFKNNTFYKESRGNLSFYYVNDGERIRSKYLVDYYVEIIGFYNSIFGNTKIRKFDIVSLGILDGIGGGAAYFRKELIVSERMDLDLDNIEEVKLNISSLLSHELGHNWFYGADYSSWEDWLNETCATWASLLYALTYKNTKLFNKIILESGQIQKQTPIIKTPDLKRPDGVHGCGTMLLYDIYLKYGEEPILKFLQSFIEIDEKTTDNLLINLRKKLGDKIPSIIERRLQLDDYSNLCI